MTLAGVFIWGSLAFGIALNLHTGLMAAAGLSIHDIRLGIAPVLEEILKASLLVLVFVGYRRSSPALGILYGFTIGLGFALTESLYFASQTPEMALTVGLTRVFSTHLMHGAGTAITGLALAARNRRMQALALAVGLHMVFNALNYHLTGNLRLLVLVGLGIGCAFVIQFLMNNCQIRRLKPAAVYAD